MVTRELLDKVKETTIGSEEINARVVEELEDIVKEAEPGLDLGHVETAYWFYGVPMAGVRYYSYEDRPTPVEGVKGPRRDVLTPSA